MTESVDWQKLGCPEGMRVKKLFKPYEARTTDGVLRWLYPAELEPIPTLESPTPAIWRTGTKVPLNIYKGDGPMFQCHTPEDAAEVVMLLNRASKERDANA